MKNVVNLLEMANGANKCKHKADTTIVTPGAGVYLLSISQFGTWDENCLGIVFLTGYSKSTSFGWLYTQNEDIKSDFIVTPKTNYEITISSNIDADVFASLVNIY